jgi:hypothetical protein
MSSTHENVVLDQKMEKYNDLMVGGINTMEYMVLVWENGNI